MKNIITGVIFLCMPLAVQAQEDAASQDSMLIQPSNTPGPKFFPIDRSGRPSTVRNFNDANPSRALRSDSGAMNNGFFRIDRQKATPMPLQHALIATPSVNSNITGSDDPRIIRGVEPTPQPEEPPVALTPAFAPTNGDPVLSLFNSNNSGHTFRDTLLGRPGTRAPAAPLAPLPTNTTTPIGPSSSAVPGAHLWPLPIASTQKVSSGFGMRMNPTKANQTQFHGGIDIAAPIGTPVLASANGTVEKVGFDGAYGQSISILNADGSESKYGHLSAQKVKAGQAVRAGQDIGSVGATGRVTGPHLDYRISQNGMNLDPLKILTLPGDVPVDRMTNIHTAAVASAAPTKSMVNAKQERLIVVR